ncbi:hypothetical protein K438DRAFT_760631 [Mycena galopus ATCC 62051]|nr:hypothetical protein K438DRAFT_760631 [Mycena galopus ATCC 62051]
MEFGRRWRKYPQPPSTTAASAGLTNLISRSVKLRLRPGALHEQQQRQRVAIRTEVTPLPPRRRRQLRTQSRVSLTSRRLAPRTVHLADQIRQIGRHHAEHGRQERGRQVGETIRVLESGAEEHGIDADTTESGVYARARSGRGGWGERIQSQSVPARLARAAVAVAQLAIRGKGVPLTSSNLSALEASDRYPTAEDLAAPRRPRPRGGSDASASSSRISVAAFREVHARRSAAGSPAFDGPGGGSTANLGAGMGGGSSRDLPRENLNRSRENLGMTVGNRSRENLGGGGMYNLANASRSQGNQAQQGRDRPQRETPPQQQQRQQSGPQQQQQQQQRTPPQQYPQQGQQTPQKAPPPPAKTTPGKHYQQRAQTQSNVSQTQRREQTQRANTQPQPPPQQNTPNKKTGQGHTREAQQWQSDTSASEDENEDGSAPSSAEPTDSNSKKPPPLGRAAKSDAGHGHREAPRAASSLGVYGMGAPPSASVSTGNVATTNVARPAVATSKRLSQPVLPALQIPSSAPIRPQAPPQQRRPPPPAAHPPSRRPIRRGGFG